MSRQHIKRLPNGNFLVDVLYADVETIANHIVPGHVIEDQIFPKVQEMVTAGLMSGYLMENRISLNIPNLDAYGFDVKDVVYEDGILKVEVAGVHGTMAGDLFEYVAEHSTFAITLSMNGHSRLDEDECNSVVENVSGVYYAVLDRYEDWAFKPNKTN